MYFINRREQYILALVLFALLFLFGYLHATKGIDLTDEGMYISTAMRYSMGDIPFRDEIMNLMRPFDILMSPLFRIYPDISLLQIRLLGNTLHTLSFILLFLFLARYVSPLVVALLCSVMFLMNNAYGILSPSYNLLSTDFLLISLVLWLFAMIQDKKIYQTILSLLGGLFFSGAVISYPTLSLVTLVPVSIMALSLTRPKEYRRLFYPSAIFLSVFAAAIMAAFALILFSGMLPELIRWSNEVTMTNKLRFLGPMARISDLAKEAKPYMLNGLVFISALTLLLLAVPAKRKRGDIAVALAVLFLLVLVFHRTFRPEQDRTKYGALVVLAFSLPAVLPALFFNKAGDYAYNMPLSWGMVRNILIAWGGISAFIYGVSSTNSLRSCLLGITPLFIAVMVSFYMILGYYAKNPPRTIMWPLIFFIVVMLFLNKGIRFYYQYVYREAQVNRLTCRFSHPKLIGIYSTPEKVSVVEELLSYINSRVKPGDYLLAYNYIPMLYFLTNTRPSYRLAWARDDLPLRIRKRLLSAMIDDRRIPEYCVRMLTFPKGDWETPMEYSEKSPIDLYVKENYYLEKTIYPFEVWHRIDQENK